MRVITFNGLACNYYKRFKLILRDEEKVFLIYFIQITQLSSESGELRNQLDSVSVEKNVIEMSLEHMKLEFARLSEAYATNEKMMADEKNKSKVKYLICACRAIIK